MRVLLRRNTAHVATALLVFGIVAQATFACPPCGYTPIPTITEELEQQHVAVIASLESFQPPSGVEGDRGSSIYTIVKVQHNSTNSTLKTGDVIQTDFYNKGKAGDSFLLLGTCHVKEVKLSTSEEDSNRGLTRIDTSHLSTSEFFWSYPRRATTELVNYIDNIPPAAAPRVDRLKYYQMHLESPNEDVADDAFSEISRLTYDELVAFSPYMNPEKLREYITNRNTNITRIGHYGVMLGLCGNASDAKMLEERIRIKGEVFRIGIDGLMSGYLLLARENGIQFLIENKIKPFSEMDSAVPFSEGYAAMQALRFAAEMTPEEIDHVRIHEAMQFLLLHPDAADLAIHDLARWKDWSIADRLLKMFQDPRFDIPAIKKAIVVYFLVLLDADRSIPSGPDDATVERAIAFIKDIELNNPRLLRHARNICP